MATCALLLARFAAAKITKFRTGLIVMNSAVCLVYIVWRATAIPLHDDLMAVLDADMIPSRDFLQKTVGYFCNPNLAFVQTPQVYYNVY